MSDDGLSLPSGGGSGILLIAQMRIGGAIAMSLVRRFNLAVLVLAGLMSGAGLLGSPAWARCPGACRVSFNTAYRTCQAACVPAGPGRDCRSACKAERRAEKVTC